MQTCQATLEQLAALASSLPWPRAACASSMPMHIVRSAAAVESVPGRHAHAARSASERALQQRPTAAAGPVRATHAAFRPVGPGQAGSRSQALFAIHQHRRIASPLPPCQDIVVMRSGVYSTGHTIEALGDQLYMHAWVRQRPQSSAPTGIGYMHVPCMHGMGTGLDGPIHTTLQPCRPPCERGQKRSCMHARVRGAMQLLMDG